MRTPVLARLVAPALLSSRRMSLRLVVSHPESVEAELSSESTGSERARATRMRGFRRNHNVVGACGVCGVTFSGTTERVPDVRVVLGVHERICPGGSRTGEIVSPFVD
jgi:hypothetical protein